LFLLAFILICIELSSRKITLNPIVIPRSMMITVRKVVRESGSAAYSHGHYSSNTNMSPSSLFQVYITSYILSKRLNLILWLYNDKTAMYAQSLF
jgi:hypothetical protein